MTYRLNVLGTLDLRDNSGTPVNSVLQQPRRLALLVYLALADREAMVKRDTLLGLFWPDMPQENGRRALSQAIHFLRRSLGSDAITARGNDDLALNPDVIECDANLFLQAVKNHDARAASASYTGDLLPGFFVSGANEFEDWLSSTRDALRRAGAEVFWTAAEEAKLAGQLVSAAASARRAAGLASDSETATRRLMEFLEQIDDRAGALDAYDALVRTLQVEFECTPSAKTRTLAERIRRDQAGAAETPVEMTVIRNPMSRLPWREIRNHSRTLAGAGIMMVAFLSLWGLGKRVGRAPALRTDASVAVADVKVFDPALHDVASTVATELSAALVDVPKITVQANADAAADPSKAPHFVLKPNVSNHNGAVYVVASLIDKSTSTIVRSASFTANGNDPAAVQAMALDMSEFARKAMGRHIRQTVLMNLKSPDAAVLTQAGLARIRSDSLRGQGLNEYALLVLQQADSVVASAIANRPSAALYVERAELAHEREWVYFVPPLINMAKVDEEVAAGIKYADAAIEMDGRNADAYELRGLFAHELSLTQSGNEAMIRSQEAEKYLQTATDLNPSAARAWNALSSVLIAKGDYARAYFAAEKAYAADPYMDVADGVTSNLFTAALETGDTDAAQRWCSDMSRRSKNNWIGAYCSLQLIAWEKKPVKVDITRAEHIAAHVSESEMNAAFAPFINSLLAVVYAKSGDSDRANALLARTNQGPMADEAQPYRAWALTQLGEREAARSILNAFVRKNPALRAGVTRSGRFSAL